MLHPKCCTKNLTVFKFDPTSSNISQRIATYRNSVAKRMQHVVPNNMLQDVALKCCERLARPLNNQMSKINQIQKDILLYFFYT